VFTRILNCLPILIGVAKIIWPEKPPPDGKTVRRQLFGFLSRKRREAPQRGRGAYLRRFIENVQKVTRSYARGLFHCYDDSRIPHTSNEIESLNGSGKLNLRRCAGRASTANGPGSSYGEAYMFAVAFHLYMPLEEINEILLDFKLEEYRHAHRLLEAIHAPAARRRSMMRNPEKYLAEIVSRWHGP
jgi:hypothetical protein